MTIHGENKAQLIDSQAKAISLNQETLEVQCPHCLQVHQLEIGVEVAEEPLSSKPVPLTAL
jgi:hypothetical protein